MLGGDWEDCMKQMVNNISSVKRIEKAASEWTWEVW